MPSPFTFSYHSLPAEVVAAFQYLELARLTECGHPLGFDKRSRGRPLSRSEKLTQELALEVIRAYLAGNYKTQQPFHTPPSPLAFLNGFFSADAVQPDKKPDQPPAPN